MYRELDRQACQQGFSRCEEPRCLSLKHRAAIRVRKLRDPPDLTVISHSARPTARAVSPLPKPRPTVPLNSKQPSGSLRSQSQVPFGPYFHTRPHTTRQTGTTTITNHILARLTPYSQSTPSQNIRLVACSPAASSGPEPWLYPPRSMSCFSQTKSDDLRLWAAT